MSSTLCTAQNIGDVLSFSHRSFSYIVKSRKSLAEDHLWLLQTEPQYLKRYCRQLQQLDPMQRWTSKDAKASVVHFLLLEDIRMVTIWRYIEAELQNAHDALFLDKSGDKKLGMVGWLDKPWGAIEALLDRPIESRHKHILGVLRESLGFAHHYESNRGWRRVPKELYGEDKLR